LRPLVNLKSLRLLWRIGNKKIKVIREDKGGEFYGNE